MNAFMTDSPGFGSLVKSRQSVVTASCLRYIEHQLAKQGIDPIPSRSSIYRCLKTSSPHRAETPAQATRRVREVEAFFARAHALIKKEPTFETLRDQALALSAAERWNVVPR
jgi:hypothetical protein